MQKLSGKIAIITGGSSGIGLAAAKRFVEEGAHVFITGSSLTMLTSHFQTALRNSRNP
jgi:NAD(P)-dependent dehydrogenase (short-subunit alcohol dehydrogenase family)